MNRKSIDESFATFMHGTLPTVPVESPTWFKIKQGFIGGVGGGMGILPFKGVDDVLIEAWEICCSDLLFASVPPEGRTILPNGVKGINELGVIHLTTAMEQADPADAERIRRIRYFLQAMKQKGSKPE